jgi:hypothetical protein
MAGSVGLGTEGDFAIRSISLAEWEAGGDDGDEAEWEARKDDGEEAEAEQPGGAEGSAGPGPPGALQEGGPATHEETLETRGHPNVEDEPSAEALEGPAASGSRGLCSCLKARRGAGRGAQVGWGTRAGRGTRAGAALCRRCGLPSRRRRLAELGQGPGGGAVGVSGRWRGTRFPCDQCQYVACREANLVSHKMTKHEGVMFMDIYISEYLSKNRLIIL